MNDFIYYLIDPITNVVKYVGKSKKPKTRYSQHIKKLDKSMTPKKRWLLGLFEEGLKPRLQIVKECDGDGREDEQEHCNLHQNTILNIHNPAKGVKSRNINEID